MSNLVPLSELIVYTFSKMMMHGKQLRKVVKASLVRCGYLGHSMAGLFVLVLFTQSSIYWLISIGVLLVMVETLFTFSAKDGGEWKWFIPSVLMYLCMAVPVIWIAELSLLNMRVNVKNRLNLTSSCPLDFYAINDIEASCLSKRGVSGEESIIAIDAFEVEQYNFGIAFSTIFQQSLMLVLIMGRWLMPKGGMTREELSMLLLVFIGMAADMLEFSSETVKLESIACNKTIYLIILGIWSWSLLQYTLGLTATKKRSRRKGGLSVNKDEPTTSSNSNHSEDSPDEHSLESEHGCICTCLCTCADVICGTEIWALITDIFLQDGPYFVMRMYLIITYHIFDQSMIFFTCKNALLLSLQIYRFMSVIIATCKEHRKHKKTDDDEAKLSMEEVTSFSPVQTEGVNEAFEEECELNDSDDETRLHVSNHDVESEKNGRLRGSSNLFEVREELTD